MKRIITGVYFFVVISFLSLCSCNDSATTSKEKSNEITSIAENRDTTSVPPYDPAMEPLTVGAKFTKKMGDTLGIKMYEFTVNPGDSAAMHSHPDHIWYVIEGGKLALTFKGSSRQVIDFKPGMGAISGPLSDAGKNIGKTRVKLLVVDIYRPRGK